MAPFPVSCDSATVGDARLGGRQKMRGLPVGSFNKSKNKFIAASQALPEREAEGRRAWTPPMIQGGGRRVPERPEPSREQPVPNPCLNIACNNLLNHQCRFNESIAPSAPSVMSGHATLTWSTRIIDRTKVDLIETLD